MDPNEAMIDYSGENTSDVMVDYSDDEQADCASDNHIDVRDIVVSKHTRFRQLSNLENLQCLEPCPLFFSKFL